MSDRDEILNWSYFFIDCLWVNSASFEIAKSDSIKCTCIRVPYI